MISALISALSTAFESVVDLVGTGLGGVFDAVGSLSSNIF
jgi:Flp pilus assembly pilin Flp